MRKARIAARGGDRLDLDQAAARSPGARALGKFAIPASRGPGLLRLVSDVSPLAAACAVCSRPRHRTLGSAAKNPLKRPYSARQSRPGIEAQSPRGVAAMPPRRTPLRHDPAPTKPGASRGFRESCLRRSRIAGCCPGKLPRPALLPAACSCRLPSRLPQTTGSGAERSLISINSVKLFVGSRRRCGANREMDELRQRDRTHLPYDGSAVIRPPCAGQCRGARGNLLVGAAGNDQVNQFAPAVRQIRRQPIAHNRWRQAADLGKSTAPFRLRRPAPCHHGRWVRASASRDGWRSR